MAYTSADLDKIQKAIVDLGAGDRIVKVDFSDGHSVQYSEATKKDLFEIESKLLKALNTTPRRYIKTVSRKGL
ncbi:MAG: hypothetical protein JEZ12_26630 [Desulfobacterium sp.]|nr:hypothetical protein [Desulfobacterium sp.]